MSARKTARMRRARKTRARISAAGAHRLCVFRSPRHIHAQLIAPGAAVLASASTVEAGLRKELKNGGNLDAARAVGKRIAERAVAAGIERVAFDRSGFRYHGRIKALAEAAREGGLTF